MAKFWRKYGNKIVVMVKGEDGSESPQILTGRQIRNMNGGGTSKPPASGFLLDVMRDAGIISNEVESEVVNATV